MVIVAAFGTAQAQPAGYLYSKPFSITNSSSQVDTNYTIALLVNTHDLIAAGKMRDSGQDIRFGTPCTGTKLFSYYIDSGINTANTLIYVKIDTLKPNSTRTIYMFYGNPSANAATTINALDGPYTMFNNQDLFSTQGGFTFESLVFQGDTTQSGVYFQPNQKLLVTALGSYLLTNSSEVTMQLSSYDHSGNSGTVIANKDYTTSSSSETWSFTNLPKPIVITPDSNYAVTVLMGASATSLTEYFFGSNSIPTTSAQVNVLGQADGFPSGFPPALQSPPFVFSSSGIEGYTDIKYYVEPIQSSYITYLADTAINAATGIDPVSKLVCPGTTTSFTAIAGGPAPTYQWQVNTGNAWVNVNANTVYSGVNLPTLTITGTTAAMSGYQYRTYMTSTCGTGYSQPATLTINTSPAITPVATITGPNPACQYTNATYTLSTNVPSGTYVWYKDGVNTGFTTNQYSFAPSAGGNGVYAVVTTPNNAAIGCFTVPIAVTNQINVTVGSNFTPTDSIAASSNNGCSGTTVDFHGYGNVVGGTYQWYVNGVAVAGATASTYTYAPNNADQVTEMVTTPNNGCYNLSSVTSNPVVATTTYSETPTIQVVGPATAFEGQQITVYANITNYCVGGYKIYWYNDYFLMDSTTTASLTFNKSADSSDFISAVIVPQSPCNGTCYKSSTQSNLLTIGFTDPNVGVGNVANNNNGITVYPNPFTSKISVAGLKAGDRLTIYDMTGRAMSTVYQATGATEEYLLQNLAAGHYILRVADSEGATKANLPLSKL